MSPEEQRATNALKTKIAELKVETYENMKMYLDMDETMLKHSGHSKGLGVALETTMRATARRIEKIIREHEAKFPD